MIVRYLTKRFIGDYEPNTGECLSFLFQNAFLPTFLTGKCWAGLWLLYRAGVPKEPVFVLLGWRCRAKESLCALFRHMPPKERRTGELWEIKCT